MLFRAGKILRIFQVLIISFAAYSSISGQEVALSKSNNKHKYFGVGAGVHFSKFNGEDGSYGHFHTVDATFEEQSTLGFTAGCFFDLDISRRIAFQPEIYYNHTQHDIIYEEWNRNGTIGTVTNANFNVSYSVIKLSFPFKFSTGKSTKFGILTGPYFDIPFLVNYTGNITTNVYNEIPPTLLSSSGATDNEINKDIKGGIGGLIGLRLDMPVNNNLICFEFRLGQGFYNVVEVPDIQEGYLSFSLIYLMKLK